MLSPNAAVVLNLFLGSPSRHRYGYELMQDTGIKSGSLYPLLGRFEHNGWIVGTLETSGDGRPPRRVYHLDPDGIASAQTALDRFFEHRRVPADQRMTWSM